MKKKKKLKVKSKIHFLKLGWLSYASSVSK